MTESKDLLAFFDVLQGLPSMVTTMRGETFTSFDVRKARAAVAELIEADREYDAAKEDLATQRRQVGAVEPATARFQRAEKRRAAALAACTPAKSEGR